MTYINVYQALSLDNFKALSLRVDGHSGRRTPEGAVRRGVVSPKLREGNAVAMPAWPVLEKSIRLDAVAADGRLAQARLVTTRDGSIAGALTARPVADVPRLAARLFPLCGMAHGAAALAAIEQALGVAASPAQAALRDLVLLAEQGAALGWRLLMDWPPLIGAAPDVQGCGAIRRAAAGVNAVAERSAWLRIGGATLRLERDKLAGSVSALAQMVLALFPQANAGSLVALARALQAGGSMPARLIAAARALPADYGHHDLPRLPALDSDWFADRLAADASFSDAPTLDGVTAEVGPLAAQHHPLAGEALAQWGPGLATRLLAAALDAQVVAGRLADTVERLADDDPCEIDITRAGQGAGVVETARGPLAYYIELDGGHVRRLRSVAPTEWNFHPQGPFMAALAAAPRVPEPVAAARLLAASFDPCVPFELAPVRVSREAALDA